MNLLNTLLATDSVLSDLRNDIGRTKPDRTKKTWTQNYPSLMMIKGGTADITSLYGFVPVLFEK